DPWRVWLILGGRGAGKTRTGAEWVRNKVFGREAKTQKPARRIALIGETLVDARRVMVEGLSGLLNIHTKAEQPEYHASKNQLNWPNGAIAQLFSAEDPNSLRGPQFDAAWCDELAKWRDGEAVWDMLQFALRLGETPQVVVTTTPRPLALLQTMMDDNATVVTRAKTTLNAANLSPNFISEVRRRYAGGTLWRQEFLGEIVEDQAGTLWRRDWIEHHRTSKAPDLVSVVVAVDPPVTATESSDSCGIVVAGLGEDRRAAGVAQRSLAVARYSRTQWSRRSSRYHVALPGCWSSWNCAR
ncbi:MAG: terminase family protein, partial [Alphaproteobacteria bacterium]|nr:terminase family protein [Alphaproteobacteria bacterium]